MSSSSQSLLPSSLAIRSCSLMASDCRTSSVSTTLTLNIWNKIFSYLGFQDLKLFTEYKVKILKQPLDGEEDNHRLMMGESCIIYREDFSKVVNIVYNFTLCCKRFYELTERERTLLINAAKWPRYNRPPYETPISFSAPPSRPSPSSSKNTLIDRMVDDRENVQYSPIFPDEKYLDRSMIASLPDLSMNITSIDLTLKYRLHEFNYDKFNPRILDETFEEYKLINLPFDENETNTEQRQSPDSNGKWNCAIQ